jgi:hypothetical protein
MLARPRNFSEFIQSATDVEQRQTTFFEGSSSRESEGTPFDHLSGQWSHQAPSAAPAAEAETPLHSRRGCVGGFRCYGKSCKGALELHVSLIAPYAPKGVMSGELPAMGVAKCFTVFCIPMVRAYLPPPLLALVLPRHRDDAPDFLFGDPEGSAVFLNRILGEKFQKDPLPTTTLSEEEI